MEFPESVQADGTNKEILFINPGPISLTLNLIANGAGISFPIGLDLRRMNRYWLFSLSIPCCELISKNCRVIQTHSQKRIKAPSLNPPIREEFLPLVGEVW